DFTVIGANGTFRALTDAYLKDHALPVDARGARGGYDLVVTCSDLILQRNIRQTPIVLVQEGMTDPETMLYRLVRTLPLPRWIAGTATTGLSLGYDHFCVASEGYREFFARKGIPRDRMEVTGLPNFDDCDQYLANDFPLRGYVLVATSDTRETLKPNDRPQFLTWAAEVARGRPLVFKLHPNENRERSTAEIAARFPGARVFADGNTNHMVANCEALVTQYSSVVYTGLALGKECYSYFDIEALRRLTPLQNRGTSARNIARTCERALAKRPVARSSRPGRRGVRQLVSRALEQAS
ncbi:MAG TPA: hypothetical protein VMH39_04580, partial [Gemmatimonadaceae bacterium]|nr:hypothetical protein [Gemmatimonadaceae bacterium]